MAEPATEAGRALLATLNKYLFEEPSENEAPILAIEQEAIKDERKRLAGQVAAMPELRPGGHHFASTELISRAAVLARLSEGEPAPHAD